MRKGLLILVAALVMPGVAFGCQFDTDCDVGSRCLKQRGEIQGICAGGMNPGNDYDEGPIYDNSLDPNETVGNTCSFDVDCGPGSKCLKARGQLKGVCVR